MYSLKKLVWFAYIVVALLLGCIALLGLSQHRLSGEYNEVLSNNERVLFHFMTIRESLTESLIDDRWVGLDKVVEEIEKLNSELGRLKENNRVSDELKLALVNNVDLAGLVILLRKNPSTPEEERERRKIIQQELRSISDYLIQYDRIMVTQARERIVNFQKVVIGALGLIISLASFALILLYRNTVLPLLNLASRLKEPTRDSLPIQHSTRVVRELMELTDSINMLAASTLREKGEDEPQTKVRGLLGETINETTNGLNGIINFAQLLYDGSEQTGLGEEQKQMLQKIMESGNAIAEKWRKIQ